MLLILDWYVWVIAWISTTFPTTVVATSSDLDRLMRDYDLIPASAISRSVLKVGATQSKNGTKPARGYHRIEQVAFRALKRNFKLYLTPEDGLLARDFSVELKSGQGKSRIVKLDPGTPFIGHVFGSLRSLVSAHFDADGYLTASILTDEDTYHIEPAWRHLPDVPPGTHLVYKVGDLANNWTGAAESRNKCNYVRLDSSTPLGGASNATSGERGRVKRSDSAPRQLSDRTHCGLKLVADYRFFQFIGRGKLVTTVHYLIGLISRVNQIFRRTVWLDDLDPSGFSGMGFSIKKVIVHDDYTHTAPGQTHYNMRNSEGWNSSHLLLKFSEAEGTPGQDSCLVHLFTYRSFDKGVLGLGYIAHPRLGHPGGICSNNMPVNWDPNEVVYPNTALSSAKSSYGSGAVITREADLVTAHEFGHNWGSPHDPDTLECAPLQPEGGPYIMFTFSVSGYDPNNEKFSPCSLRSIKAVLESKSQYCFEERSDAFCGNFEVEGSEECDAGLIGDPGMDSCCTADCKLRPGALCSPRNSPCCTSQCQFKPAGHICKEAALSYCRRAARCNGTSAECSPHKLQPDGEPCIDGGECQNGTCLPFCEKKTIGMKSCICKNVAESCFRCCWNGTDCHPYTSWEMPKPLVLSPGTRCIHGICNHQGICHREVRDLVEHIWKIIERLQVNNFAKFVHDNMVATVVTFSLLIWIPASLFIHRLDCQKRAQRRKERQWRENERLVLDQNRVEVVRGIKHAYVNFHPGVFDGAMTSADPPVLL